MPNYRYRSKLTSSVIAHSCDWKQCSIFFNKPNDESENSTQNIFKEFISKHLSIKDF